MMCLSLRELFYNSLIKVTQQGKEQKGQEVTQEQGPTYGTG